MAGILITLGFFCLVAYLATLGSNFIISWRKSRIEGKKK